MLIHLTKEKICRICTHAAAKTAAAAGVSGPGATSLPSKRVDDPIDAILDRYIEEHLALLEAISSLDKNELVELMALMWLGRGDISRNPSDFRFFLEKAHRDANLDISPYHIASQVSLEMFLRNGLQYLGGHQCGCDGRSNIPQPGVLP